MRFFHIGHDHLTLSITVWVIQEWLLLFDNYVIILDTTDVQRVEAVFFENRLFLRCSFAGGSQARGCAVILTLSGTNETERFEVSTVSGGSNSLCTMANNQKDAYRSVEALDIEMNGMDGVLRLEVTPTVLTTEDEYIAMTGCKQPSKYIIIVSLIWNLVI